MNFLRGIGRIPRRLAWRVHRLTIEREGVRRVAEPFLRQRQLRGLRASWRTRKSHRQANNAVIRLSVSIVPDPRVWVGCV